MTRLEALVDASDRLAPVSDTPRLDVEILMAHALGLTREAMILGGPDGTVPAAFGSLVARRLAHEPVAYITGQKDFWSLTLAVAPGVLIPRPDSETLIEAALKSCAAVTRVLDLGTGSGALLLAALSEWPQATGVGIDASAAALDQARGNAVRLGLADRATFNSGNWAKGLTGQFDLVLCNPPYVESGADLPRDVREYEPHSALFAGPDGRDDYARIAPQLPRVLTPSGVAVIEIGHTQAAPVSALFAAQGFTCSVHQDLGGRDRCLILTRP
jgi:release factor glutamine methyltransferase